jgi:hypothetical protein
MARSRIGFRVRLMRYRLIPKQRRDLFDWIYLVFGIE